MELDAMGPARLASEKATRKTVRSLTRSIVLKRVSQGCGLPGRKKLSHPKDWYWNLEHDTACQGMLEQPEASL
jgi:hypothetical protein